MVWQLIKRDPAWRWVPRFTLGLVVWVILLQFLGPLPGTSFFVRGGLVPGFTLIALLSTAAFMAGQQQTDTALQATLPVTVRQVFVARLLSMLLLLWLPVAVVVTVLATRDSSVLVLPVRLWSVFTVVIVCIQAAAIRGVAIPQRGAIFGLAAVWMFMSSQSPIFGLNWPFGDSLPGDLALTACWLIGAAAVVRAWQVVPLSFPVAPLKLSSAQRESIPPANRKPGTNTWLPVWRGVAGWRGMSVPFLVIWMILEGSQISMLMAMFVGAPWQTARTQMSWLRALPIPRRAMLAVLFLPSVLSLAIGYEISVHVPSFPSAYERGVTLGVNQELSEWHTFENRVDKRVYCRTSNVLPSLEFWIPEKSGRAPPIQAPWGESFQPATHWTSGFDIYNPYAVDCANSQRFLDWQVNRATLAIYGRSIGRDRDGGLSGTDFLTVVAGLRTQFVGLAAICLFSLAAILVAVLNDWYRFRRLAKPVRTVIWSIVGVIFTSFFVLDMTRRLVFAQWLSWALPPSLPAAIAIVVPILAALCWAIDAIDAEVEFVDKPAASV